MDAHAEVRMRSINNILEITSLFHLADHVSPLCHRAVLLSRLAGQRLFTWVLVIELWSGLPVGSSPQSLKLSSEPFETEIKKSSRDYVTDTHKNSGLQAQSPLENHNGHNLLHVL